MRYLFIFLLTIPQSSLASNEAPQSFSVQARFRNAANTAPLTGTVTLVFGIYNPAMDCLLYEESRSGVDLDSTGGLTASDVGAGTETGNAVNTSLTLKEIFDNTRTQGAGTNCASGYTPSTGDHRVLRITATPAAGSPVSIDQNLKTIPSATTAEHAFDVRDFADRNQSATTGIWESGDIIVSHTAGSGVATNLTALSVGAAPSNAWKACLLNKYLVTHANNSNSGFAGCEVVPSGTSGNDRTWQVVVTHSGASVTTVQCRIICMK